MSWSNNVLVNGGTNGYGLRALQPDGAACTCTVATAIADCGAGGICSSNICVAGDATKINCAGDFTCNTGAGRVCLAAPGQCQTLKSHGVYSLNNYNPTMPTIGTTCGSGKCVDDSVAGLADFQRADSGWFGGDQGLNEKWGTEPS